MNVIRRLFGMSADSQTQTPASADDGIAITKDDNPIAVAPPPEPVIDRPKGSVNPADVPTVETPALNVEAVGMAEDLTPILTPQSVDLAGTRPLPPLETIVPQPGQRIIYGQRSDIGMIRSNNQDAVYSFLAESVTSEDLPDFGVFIVADGMGGHHDGEKASAITARMVLQYVMREVFDFILQQKMDDPDRPAIGDILREAVQKANEAVTDEIPEGGTTVTMAAVLGDLAYIAHVGDSRAYLITDEGMEQVTRDHSLVQRLIELDQLTPEEAAEHPQRNVLYRAIGQSDHLDVDVVTRRLLPGSQLLLCSDGLWNLVSEEDITEVATKSPEPQVACSKLVQMANDRGGPDNITVVLVKMPV